MNDSACNLDITIPIQMFHDANMLLKIEFIVMYTILYKPF